MHDQELNRTGSNRLFVPLSRFDDALQEAAQADKLIEQETGGEDVLEDRLPLLGVPISIKESLSLQGIFQTLLKISCPSPPILLRINESCFDHVMKISLLFWVHFMQQLRISLLFFSGMPHGVGVVSRRNFIQSTDPPVVAYLKRAGAIPMGVTNTPEVCLWYESNNRLTGITNNPYNLERIAGGSSGLKLLA